MRKESIMAAAFAMTLGAATFTACSDETDFEQSSTQAVVNPDSNNGFTGSFSSVNSSEASGKYLSLSIDDSMVKLNTTDAGASGEAQYTYSQDGKEINGEFQGDVDGIKSFNIRKVGTFYYKMTAKMNDGSLKLFGFTHNSPVSRAGTDDDVSIKLMKYAAKKGLGKAFELIPVVGSDLGDYVMGKIFETDEGPKDMSVKDCFEKLQQGQQQILKKLDENNEKLDKLILKDYLKELKDHITFQKKQHDINTMCLTELASIKDSIDKGVTPEVEASLRGAAKKALEEWADTKNWADAKSFITDTHHGTSDNVHWSKIVDVIAENNYAWEHQGYNYRESYRLNDLLTCMENAMLLQMYQSVTGKNASYNEAELQEVIKQYNDDQVKEDNDYAICQIKGAHHVKILRDSFRPLDTNTFFFEGRTYVGRDQNAASRYPNIEVNLDYVIGNFRELGDVVVKLRKSSKIDRWSSTHSIMFTKGEVDCILEYYNNTKSMREILEQEALVKYQGNYDSGSHFMFLQDSKIGIHTTCGSDRYPTKFTLYTDDALDLNSKKRGYGNFNFGDWGARHSGASFPNFINDHYITDKIRSIDTYPVKRIVVAYRDDNWQPAKF